MLSFQQNFTFLAPIYPVKFPDTQLLYFVKLVTAAMYCRAWLARYSDSTCADHSVVLPWWCSASTVAPSAMPRLHHGKESTCLAFFLHLCSHGLLGGGTEGPQFLCKSNVNGGKVDEYKMYLVLPCWLRCKRSQWVWSSALCCGTILVKQLKLLSLGFFYW